MKNVSEFRKSLPAGTRIFSEGDEADTAYIIEKGAIDISISNDGQEVVIATLKSGDLLGEMALIDDKPRTASADVVRDVELIVIPKAYIKKKIQLSDPTLRFFLQVIMERYRDVHSRLMHVVEHIGNNAANSHRISEDTTVDVVKKLVNQYINMQERILHAVHASDNQGNSVSRYDEELKHTTDTLNLDHLLHSALENNEFELYYQPIIDLATGYITGCEALIRWNHARLGLVAPNDFIPVAEDNGTIIPIGRWIIEEAVAARKRFSRVAENLQQAGDFYMSINLSARQFEDEGLIDDIETILKGSEADTGAIKFEITESLLVSNPELALVSLQRLKSLGVTLAIDDFGTGYSSFSYLHRYPIDTIKIDRSFVHTMCTNQKSATIVNSLTELAHNLDMDVIAEGVEAGEDQDQLCRIACDYAQGYLYSRPVPEAVFIELLGDQHCLLNKRMAG